MKQKTYKRLQIVCLLLVALLLPACGHSSYQASGDASSGGGQAAKTGSSYARPYATPAPVSSYGSDMEMAAEEAGVPMAMGEMESVAYDSAAAGENSVSGTGPESTASDGPTLDEKLVYTGNLTVQTLEYDTCVSGIRSKIKDFGGIIQSESESDDDYHWYYDDHVNSSTRSLYLTIRIPSAKFYDFLSSVGEEGKVTSRSVNVENISQTYSDTKTQIEALEIEEKRLLEMMEKADTIEDMIAVESRLTEVQSDLNYYKTRLRGMDTDVAWSTIGISVEEVKKYSPTVVEQTFGEKVREAFSDAWKSFIDFLQGLILVLIELLPFLILLAVLALLIWFILKKTAPRCEKRRLEKEIEKARKQAERQAKKQEALLRRQGQMPAGPGPYGQFPPRGNAPGAGPAQDASGAGPAQDASGTAEKQESGNSAPSTK